MGEDVKAIRNRKAGKSCVKSCRAAALRLIIVPVGRKLCKKHWSSFPPAVW